MNTILRDGELYDGETGELLNEVEQVEVEVIEDTLPAIIVNGGTHIQTNTEQLKKELAIHLEKYDIEVTADTEKDAGKAATELNKLAKDLNSKRLQVGKEIKKPADALKSSIDELIELVQEKRSTILEKVEVFKQDRFDKIRKLLECEKENLFMEMKVSPEYQFLDIECLVKETSLGKSNLSKSAKESLQSMVRAIKAMEDAVTIRTLQLKVTCIDAGLQFPIELNEVEHFIKEDTYDEQLKLMIDSRLKVELQVKEKAEAEAEIKRQAIADEELRKENLAKENEDRLKREVIEKQQQELARVEREKNEAIAKVQREADEKEADRLEKLRVEAQEVIRIKRLEQEKIDNENRLRLEQEQKSQKKTITIDVTFEVEVSLKTDKARVVEAYKKKLEEAGFTTLKSIEA